jgi:hypothetical protein
VRCHLSCDFFARLLLTHSRLFSLRHLKTKIELNWIELNWIELNWIEN